MHKIRNDIMIAVCFMVMFCQCMGVGYAAEASAALPYIQTFSENTDGLTDATGEVITEEDGNKALKLTQSQTAAFRFAQPAESSVVVSYKLKVVNLVAQGGASDFGTVKLGSDPAVQVVRYQGNLTAYNYSSDHSSSGSNNGVDLSLYADGNYHTVSYNIDFQTGIYTYNIDGKQISNVRNLRTTGIKSVDTLYFAMKNNAEILYVDDISVKEIVPTPVSYVQSFDNAETVAGVAGLTVGKGGASSIVTEADGNKVLKVTGADTLTFAPEGRTATNLVEISYKIKIGTVNESVKYKDFGTALSGAAKAVEVFRFQKNLLAYNNSTSHATSSNSNTAICILSANQDDTYHTVTYYINFSTRTYSTYFDGVLAGNSARSLRTDETTSIDSLFFDVQAGEEYYIDDVTIKDASLELRSTTPANGSTNDKIPTAVTMTFTSRIASKFAAKDYFKFYENGKLLSDYTITHSSDNTVNLTPVNGFYGNCTYTVEVDKAVNAETDGYASPEENILLSFKTEGFLVSSSDDENYGGHVMTNGKTYTFRAGYTNQSETVETPVLIIARYDGKCLTEAPFVKQYKVNAGETLHVTENYKVENTDENTKVKVMLWQGLKNAVPVAKSTLMIGEYADGTPVYEAAELENLQAKYIAKELSGFHIGLITDVQTSALSGYTTYHHHYGSLVKATDRIAVDCIADLGDAVDGGSADKEAEMNVLCKQTKILKQANVPIFRIKGNHDDNRAGMAANQNADLFITDDEWVAAVSADWDTVMEGSTAGVKPYYYKDFPEDKIRVIALDTQNVPYTYTGGSKATYHFGFSQKQLEWLADEALNFADKSDKSEWGVIFLMHTIAANESPNVHNFTVFNKIFSAFENGTSGTASREDDLVPITDLSYDFTDQGAMEVICILDGHTHKDGISYYGKSVKITTASSLPRISGRELKTATEDAWDIITIDRKNRKIHCTRFGAGEDREIAY